MFLVLCLARAVFQGQYFCVCLELQMELVCAEFLCSSPISVQNAISHFYISLLNPRYINFKTVRIL